MKWGDIPHRKRKVMDRLLTPHQKGLWKEPKVDKIERMRNLFGGMPGEGHSNLFHHYGLHIGSSVPLAARREQVKALGGNVVKVSQIQGDRFLALWKVPEGELLLP